MDDDEFHKMMSVDDLTYSTLFSDEGDSGIDNLAYLSGDDTSGTGHTMVYESSNSMLVGNSISEDQSESDRDLEDGCFSDDEIYSDSDDGDYFMIDESLERTLDASFKSFPCTVVSSQAQHSLTDLDPSARST